MRHFYIIANDEKPNAANVKQNIVEYLESRGAVCKTSCGVFERGTRFTAVSDVPEDTECVITLGGDGTLLRAARDLAGRKLPIIGINLGNLGYLTEMNREGDPKELLDALLEDRYEIQERMMLKGNVYRGGQCIKEDIALNDIVLARGSELRVLRFDLYVDDKFLNQYSADGMIVATPTGSTAYNLSTGGPIAQPDGKMIILTPICPHTLTSRTIVLGADSRVRLQIPEGGNSDVVVSFDGDTTVNLSGGDYCEIVQSDMVTRVIKLDQRSFLDILKRKMYET